METLNEFITEWLNKAKIGKCKIVRSEPSYETKNSYYGVIETGHDKLVVFLGDQDCGDNLSWGFVIERNRKEQYI